MDQPSKSSPPAPQEKEAEDVANLDFAQLQEEGERLREQVRQRVEPLLTPDESTYKLRLE